MVESLTSVWEQIVENAGENPDDLLDKMLGRRNKYGYDTKNKKFGNMITMGIVDPFKVTKNAVLNSASVASIILTTSCVISNKRIREDESSR
jgi:chaperonin GroEL